MAIEPEKAEPGSNEGRAKNRQLAGVGIKRDLEILGDAEIARRVGQQRISKCDRDCAADRQSVETIRQVDCVRGTSDDEREKEKREWAHVYITGSLKNGR